MAYSLPNERLTVNTGTVQRAPGDEQVNAKRVVYLDPTFYPYCVAPFEELYRCIGDGFAVVALRNHPDTSMQAALRMGTFPRRLIRGWSLTLSRNHLRGKKTPLGLAYAPSMPLVLSSLKPDVVCSVNFNLWTLTSIAMGYPTVLVWEGTEHTERTVRPWRKRLRLWMAKRAKAFVVNGILSRQYLSETLGVAPERIVEGGICAELPPPGLPREPKVLTTGPVKFLCVARMIEGKGFGHLLHAARILKTRLGEQARFEVIALGEGPERQNYERLTQELGLGDCVQFIGGVASHEVWKHYADAHVFVLPTLQDIWAVVVGEAMSMGLPVLVSTYAGSVPDLVHSGENGYVFDPEDHNALAGYMERYIADPTLITSHGRRSLELVAPHTPERVALAHMRAIEAAGTF